MKHTYSASFAPAAAILAVMAIVAATFFIFPGVAVRANPFYTGTKAKTAIATTTLAYLAPGTGTTTPVYDSYEVNGTNQTNGGNLTLPDTLAVLLQGTASSTLTTVTIACEYSDDNVDWYQNNIVAATSTSGTQILTSPNAYAFTYASSTVGGSAVLANSNRFQKTFTCPAPTRYIRAVITDTGAGAGVWATLVPKKQRN